MIGPEDIDAFAERNGEALAQAAEYARRAGKGIPVDRWASVRQAHLVAQGIRALTQIVEFQTATIEALRDEHTPTE